MGIEKTLSDEEKLAVYRCARENAGGLPVVRSSITEGNDIRSKYRTE